MNEVCSDFSNPRLFATDEKQEPVATQIVEPSSSSAVAVNQSSSPSQLTKQQSSSITNTTTRRRKPDSSTLTVRFVQARLLHFKLHTLQKLGFHVKDKDVAAADSLFYSVEEEIAALGVMVAPELVQIDSAFQSSLAEVSDRVASEKSNSGAFRAETWYGALCKQVDEHAELLVAHRNLEREKALVERQRDELAKTVQVSAQSTKETAKEYLKELTVHRQRAEQATGGGGGGASLTAKLTAELAMKEAEKQANQSSSSNNLHGASSSSWDGRDAVAGGVDAQVAKSLRLQDEVTVLRKSTNTLNLALARVQHQYGVLLQEHEKLKSEIRLVIAQQDAEENDIRKIFLGREREFDVAMRRIGQLERENEKLNKVLSGHQQHQHASTSSSSPSTDANNKQQQNLAYLATRRQKQQQNSGGGDFGSPSSSSQQFADHNRNDGSDADAKKKSSSLATRMANVRDKTVPKLTTAYSSAQPELEQSVIDLAEAQQKRLTATPTSLVAESAGDDDDTLNRKNAPPPPPPRRIEDDHHDAASRSHLDDQQQSGGESATPTASGEFQNTAPDEDGGRGSSLESTASSQDEATTAMQPEQLAEKTTTEKADEAKTLKPTTTTRRKLVRAHTASQTEMVRQSILVSAGTQTFLRQPKPNDGKSNNNSTSKTSTSSGAATTQQPASAAGGAISNQQMAAAMAEIGALKETLEKFSRLMNKQANVIEKYLDENYSFNVLRRRDLCRMLKQFGVPFLYDPTATATTTSNSNSSSNNNNNNKSSSSSWHNTLHRFQVAADLEKQIDEIESQRLQSALHCALMADKETVQVQTDLAGVDTALVGDVATTGNNNSNTNVTTTTTTTTTAPQHHRRPASSSAHKTSSSSSSSSFSPSITVPTMVTPSSFWNAPDAVTAIKRVYVDAGRLIDTVEQEQSLQEKVQAVFSSPSSSSHHHRHDHSDMIDFESVGAAAAAVSTATTTAGGDHPPPPLLLPTTAAVEKIATDQFFAIRTLESSCNMLLTRLSNAKEEYVKRFYDRSSLLNQTLGTVSRTHPREANRLSRLAKSVQEARAVVPWMSAVVEHHHSQHRSRPESPPLCFKASEIVLGTKKEATTPPQTPPPSSTPSQHHHYHQQHNNNNNQQQHVASPVLSVRRCL